MPELERLIQELAALAREAGRTALAMRREGVATETKADCSPVTQADRAAEAMIVKGLGAIAPGVPVVAEEAFAAGMAASDIGCRFFLVDPIDGTREFVNGRDEFTVNIALVEDGFPVAGVVVAPALGETFEGSALGAFRTDAEGRRDPIAIRRDAFPLTALASRSHRTAETDGFLARIGVEEVLGVGSSLKFCRVAEGRADLYPCLGFTMEWDTAAGQAVVEAAGGAVVDLQNRRLCYGKRDDGGPGAFRNPFFVAHAQCDIAFEGT